MSDFQQKINDLYWLKAMGIKYYWSKFDSRGHDNLKDQPILPSLPTKPATGTANLGNFNTVNKESPVQQTLINDEHNVILQSRQLADRVDTLDQLRATVMAFKGCDLHKLATNTVFSDGNPQAPFMFIGEAPGRTEDKMGIPFCGESGKLLDNILKAVGILRSKNAYITNIVFWRPPANRVPTQTEVDICRPFVEKHIALIKPKLIVLVGSVAATCLLGKHAGISKIRQEYYHYLNQYLSFPIPTTALFHPAYLLRQPLQKKTTWYDLLKIADFAKEQQIAL